MKVLVFLALVGMALGLECDMEEVDSVRSAASTVTDYIMGNCRPNNAAFSVLLNSDSCVALFNAGKCYYDNALDHYTLDDNAPVTYGVLKDDVDNLKDLGNVLCVNVEDCYTPIKRAVLACNAADADFRGNVIAKVQELYEVYVPDAQTYADENQDNVMGTLLQIALSRFTSVDQAITMFQEYTQGTSVDEAETAAAAIKLAASNFCTSGCVDSSAGFIKKLFNHLHKAASCPNAQTFCGGCENKAAQFMRRKESIPCCLRTVVDAAIEGSTMVQAKYASEIARITAYIEEEFDGKQALLDEIKATKNFVLGQVACLQSVYDGSPNLCA